MHKGRLEAFTDGVIAVIITVMVLEMKAPPGADLAALASTLPVFITYALSFTNVAIWWNNHHHMLQASKRVDGWALWANLFILFWLSLVPFVIRWMDETDFAALLTAAYGFILAMAGLGWLFLERALIACLGPRRWTRIKRQAFGGDLRRCDRACLCRTVDRSRPLYSCCNHVVRAGPAHRVDYLNVAGLARQLARS
jgi:uncharacterized membrane protein